MAVSVKPSGTQINWNKVETRIPEAILSDDSDNAIFMETNRKYIWCLKLGIGNDHISSIYKPFYEELKSQVVNYAKRRKMNSIQKQIANDVRRTFVEQ